MPFSPASTTDLVTLFASAVVTAQNTGDPGVAVSGIRNGVIFTLDVTAAATLVGDTLDVYVQALTMAGKWVDVVHFTQLMGNGSTKQYRAKILAGTAEAMFENASALAAGSVRNIIGDLFRMRCDVAGSPSFTFSLTALAI